MPDSDKNSENGRAENEPSSLDELTHAELSLLYKESTDTVRFAKHLQWWTVGSTLVAFLALIGMAKLVSSDRVFANQLTGVIILLTMAVIFTLVVYQFWQHTELAKIEAISKNFSSLFTDIRRLKSRREANVHRYLLLLFMIAVILLGAVVTYLGLLQLVEHRFQ